MHHALGAWRTPRRGRRVHRVVRGACRAVWTFKFGFVIPGSTNSWQQTIEADKDHMLPAEVLSGNLTIESSFYDGEELVSQSTVRVFYE